MEGRRGEEQKQGDRKKEGEDKKKKRKETKGREKMERGSCAAILLSVCGTHLCCCFGCSLVVLMTNSAFVGHLGTKQLAGSSLAQVFMMVGIPATCCGCVCVCVCVCIEL